MTWLNAGMLAGLVAIAIPVVLHLLRRPRPRDRVFAAVRLITPRVRSASRRQKLRRWWLLLVRMLLIALVCLALASPLIAMPASDDERWPAMDLVIVLDDSASMTAEVDGRSRWQRAMQQARAVLDARTGGHLGLVTPTSLAFAAEPSPRRPPGLTSPLPPTLDASLARTRLADARPQDAAASLEPAIALARQWLRDLPAGNPRRIIVLTDQPDAVDAEPTGGVAIDAIDVRGDSAVASLGVEADVPFAGRWPAGEPLVVSATLTSSTGDRSAVVQAYLGETLRNQQSLSPGETQRFALGPAQSGPRAITLRHREPDGLPADDQQPLAIAVVPPAVGWLIADEPRDEWARATAAALAPLAPGDRLRLQTVPPRRLSALADAEPRPAIVALRADAASSTVIDELARYVRAGGHVLMLPPTQGPTRLGDAVGTLTLGAPQAVDAMGLRLGEAAFWSRPPRPAIVEAVRLTARWPLTIDANDRVLLRFADGSPAAIQRRIGAGAFSTVAILPQRSAGNLAASPLWLDLVQRLVDDALPPPPTIANVSVGELARVALPPGDARLHRPDGASQPITGSELVFRPTMAGHWVVRQGEADVAVVAARVPPREIASALTEPALSQAQDALRDASALPIEGEASFIQLPLTSELAGVLLVLLLVESVLANRRASEPAA